MLIHVEKWHWDLRQSCQKCGDDPEFLACWHLKAHNEVNRKDQNQSLGEYVKSGHDLPSKILWIMS